MGTGVVIHLSYQINRGNYFIKYVNLLEEYGDLCMGWMIGGYLVDISCENQDLNLVDSLDVSNIWEIDLKFEWTGKNNFPRIE